MEELKKLSCVNTLSERKSKQGASKLNEDSLGNSSYKLNWTSIKTCDPFWMSSYIVSLLSFDRIYVKLLTGRPRCQNKLGRHIAKPCREFSSSLRLQFRQNSTFAPN